MRSRRYFNRWRPGGDTKPRWALKRLTPLKNIILIQLLRWLRGWDLFKNVPGSSCESTFEDRLRGPATTEN